MQGMQGIFKAVQITDKVYWVGAVDWAIRDFHGYSTSRGTTYNAFLILADKVTLIDTVKRPFLDEMMSRIASVVDPAKIDYLVSNHGEMDHSGCLPQVLELVKPEKVFASPKGIECLNRHFYLDREITAVKEGERLSLGNRTLSFQLTPMLHWPESMISLIEEDGVLFSQDAFGMHLAANALFADEVERSVLEYEAAKYFANILLPYAGRIAKLLEATAKYSDRIRMILPDHGPVWRFNPTVILDLYYHWTHQEPSKRGLVVYDTMWESTARMARALGEGMVSGGIEAQLIPIRASHRSDIATELLRSGALAVGTPTLNNGMFPTVADTLHYLKGLRPLRKVGAVFGSYGWSGEGVKEAAAMMEAMKVDLVGEPLGIKYVPDNEALAQCRSLGEALAERLIHSVDSSVEQQETGLGQ